MRLTINAPTKQNSYFPRFFTFDIYHEWNSLPQSVKTLYFLSIKRTVWETVQITIKKIILSTSVSFFTGDLTYIAYIGMFLTVCFGLAAAYCK